MNVTTRRSMVAVVRTVAGAAALTLVAGMFAGAAAETALAATDAAPSAMQQEQSEGYSQYQEARRALNRAEYARAVELLEQYRQSQSDGDYVPESLYWQAFALSRMENTAGLRTGLDLLRRQLQRYEESSVTRESRALMARIHGELARRGDEESARWVYENSAEAARDRSREETERDRDRDRDQERTGPDETKLVALQALMNMDSEKAVPILRRVVEDRDNDPELRRQALFILSQQDDDVADLMLDAARNDPDPEVREQALFWLAQSGAERALPVLESILQNPDDARLHEQALFAASQLDDPRAQGLLRDFARSTTVNPELRKNAIFWLGDRDAGNAGFMRDLWDTTTDPGVREAILFSMSQMRNGASAEWLMEIALDETEEVEIRKMALFTASQREDVAVGDLASVYDRAPDRELKQQALFVLSQSDEPAAFDKMLDVVRTEDDPELRQNAIFWLGQSGDPRAEDVLIEILED